MLSEEVPDGRQGVVTQVVVPGGLYGLYYGLNDELGVVFLVSLHHQSLQGADSLLRDLLIIDVLCQLAD